MGVLRNRIGWACCASAALALVAAGCGSSSKSSGSAGESAAVAATPVQFTIQLSETSPGVAKLTGPSAITGGLVTLNLQNTGSAPHSAQLVRIEGGHTIPEALEAIGSPSAKTPAWLHAEGGVGAVQPSASGSATMNLPAGQYAAIDVYGATQSHSGTQPAELPFTVSAGKPGPLPASLGSGVTITAANPSKDHYRWEIAGKLTTHTNNITFNSKGSQALHEITAVRITGNQPVTALVKALERNGPPPSYVDTSTEQSTAVLDGGKSLTTGLTLSKPGTYILFCHLSDRDGGKPHFAEGLITKVVVE